MAALRLTPLQMALTASVAVHLALLGVRFADPEAFNRMFDDSPLEVVLVNSRSAEAPDKAQAIAQANLAGGGEANEGRATSPLPSSPLTENGDANEDARRQVEQMQEAQQQMLAELRKEMALLPPTEQAREAGTPEERELEEKRRQRLEMLAQIERRISDENARPRKRFISPATREEVYAIYYDQLRRKIEERGTRNFPENLGQKLYGQLIMRVTVDADGRVIDAAVARGSGSRALDRRAVAIVMAAGPFERFSERMKKGADQLEMTWGFKFSRDDGLEMTLTAPS
ncbi:MAG: TonB family protein [Pseudomonadota bacterium]|nr:TonB family protein [Pseudomonadota bacterium]